MVKKMKVKVKQRDIKEDEYINLNELKQCSMCGKIPWTVYNMKGASYCIKCLMILAMKQLDADSFFPE